MERAAIMAQSLQGEIARSTDELARRCEMTAIKMAAIALIVAGVLGLVYGGFSYTKETHSAKVGSLELSVKDNETVNIPVWAGVGAIVIGGILFLVPRKS
jgi:TRAP-type C4-dicarboxylate transport system permease small subunit